MLRLLIRFTLYLLIVFTGVGVLVSHPWGWSEYAAPQLYVIYAEAPARSPDAFFLLNIDGSEEPMPLTGSSGTLRALACSPDGRTLAFLTDAPHLYVVSRAGPVYDRALGQGYDTLKTANDGTVALSRTDVGITIIVSAGGHRLPVPPDNIAYDPISVASSGYSLWSHTVIGGIKLVSPSGEKALTLSPGTSAPNWMASEQMFTFRYYDQTRRWNGGVVDAVSHQIIWFRDGLLPYGVLSPDATEQVFSLLDTGGGANQLYLVDPLTKKEKRQLTHDAGVTHNPVCFLSFKPGMLTATPG